MLPITLILGQQSITVSGMIDSGATVNVLPYDIGLRLGADWGTLNVPVRLTGALAHLEA